MSILESIRNNFKFMAVKSIEKRIDGKDITKKLDAFLDSDMGERMSEKVQRGPISLLLHEMQLGLYDENPMALAEKYMQWAHNIRIIHAKPIKD